MAICGHLASVRRRREMILSSTQIRLLVMHQFLNRGYISNGYSTFWFTWNITIILVVVHS